MKLRCAAWGTVIAIVAITGSISAGETIDRKRRVVADYLAQSRAERAHDVGLEGTDDRGPIEDAVPLSVEDGQTWLESNQNADGSWGSVYPLIVTSTGLETLSTIDPCSDAVASGAEWLVAEDPSNYEFLARQTIGLSHAGGHEGMAVSLAEDLLALRNPVEPDNSLPNWPEGGWGIADGFESDSLTTALALQALDRTGFNGGFQATSASLAGGATNLHEWEVPSDAVKVRLLITVEGSEVRLCMTEGAPPPFCSPYFPLPPGGPYQIVFPDSGLPFTSGTNFVVVESPNPPALPATYTMTASYETPTFDTRSLAEPLDYLMQAQNVDGGWGLQRGQPSELFTTLHVLGALFRYAPYELDTEITTGISYVTSFQLGDGSFGLGGPGVPYVTALAALDLIRSETPPFGIPTEDAVSALLLQQDIDGSWNQEAYDTALAVLALWAHDLPPTADAGPDRIVNDVDQNCVEDVTLLGSGSSPDGAIAGYEWREECATLATGSGPTVSLATGDHDLLLTVTADDGQTAHDVVRVTVVSAELDQDFDTFFQCTGDCDDLNGLIWATPGEARNVHFTDEMTFVWEIPESPGGVGLVYDALRSSDAANFTAGAICVEADDGSDGEAQDPAEPASGAVFFYLIRAQNDCPIGQGSLGESSAGVPRIAVDCL